MLLAPLLVAALLVGGFAISRQTNPGGIFGQNTGIVQQASMIHLPVVHGSGESAEEAAVVPNTGGNDTVVAGVSCPLPDQWVPYTVNPTDSLFRLSILHGITLEELKSANCLGDDAVIFPSQIIYVPRMTVATITPFAFTPFPTIGPLQAVSNPLPEQQQPVQQNDDEDDEEPAPPPPPAPTAVVDEDPTDPPTKEPPADTPTPPPAKDNDDDDDGGSGRGNDDDDDDDRGGGNDDDDRGGRDDDDDDDDDRGGRDDDDDRGGRGNDDDDDKDKDKDKGGGKDDGGKGKDDGGKGKGDGGGKGKGGGKGGGKGKD